MHASITKLIAAVAIAGLAGSVMAAPIVYNAQLVNGIPVNGTTIQPNGNASNPVGAEYYSFYATAGSNVSIIGDRLDAGFDMSFWILSGTYNDTNQFGATFDAGDAAFTLFADDEDAPNIPGPFGDPNANFIAPLTGLYTVAVTNFLSSGGPPFDFRLVARGVSVPEPGTLALIGLGLAGLGFLRRR